MSEGDRASRPNSLLLEAPPPEREPLHFDVQLVGAPPEVEQLVNNIKQVAEEFLYHWKTFPIVLPPTRFSGPGNRPSDIIIPPPCDELDAAALDAGMEAQPLSAKQLHAIREKGEFEVPSRHFPGQIHVWRVSGWLQRGRLRAREELYCHVARALALLVVVARDRLARPEPFSVRAGLRSLLNGLHRLLDLIFGMPSMEARDLEKKLREERSRYLVAELICKPEHQEDIAALAAWVTRAMRRAASEKTDAREPHRPPPRVPCVYTTPQRTQVDLRLYRREVIRRAAAPLQTLVEREARGWFLHFRERRAAQLASQKVPMRDIEEEVRLDAMREYVTRVCNAVICSAALSALGEGVPELLADQLRAHAILHRAEEGVRKKLESGLATAEARIRASHPILSRSEAWRREKLSFAAQRLKNELRWTAMEDAAAAMQAHKLHQHRYFLLRDLAFLRDREPLLMKELSSAQSPTRTFSWATRIWVPRRWAVVRHFRGRGERIPTVVVGRPAPAGPHPPPLPPPPRSDPAHPVFLLDADTTRVTTTRWPAWRLLNLAHRTWCWGWNMMFVLGVLVPWCSPLSLRTLISVKPFATDYELSQVNGTLYPKRSSETQTMWSRLLALWRHVSKQRTRFETEPDTGLLGKGLSRQANRVWNYGVVGGLGSLALLVAFPVASLVVSGASAAAAVTVPIWMPPMALLLHLACIALYDFDCPNPHRLNRWFVLAEVLLWRIAILGVLQPIAALLVALVICPLAALLLLIGGVCWWWSRGVWERVAWRCLLAKGARVPAHDSAFATRLSGPGLRNRTYYQITAGQAVAAVVARAEVEVLVHWAGEVERAIDRPLADYNHFVHACFGPFSVQIAKTGPYRQLEKECSELSASLREKVSARKRELALPLNDAVRARVRMTSQDLRRAIHGCATELSRVWGSASAWGVGAGVGVGVGARGPPDDWWASRGLSPRDWHALAANTLVEVFDAEVLVALEEGEARLVLEGCEGGGVGGGVWTQRTPRDTPPPDVLAERDDWRRDTHESGMWCDWGGTPLPRVAPPSLEVGAFSPRHPHHPPLPHPAAVALVLHNRESDNPVPLDSELCAEILRSLEDAPDSDDKREDVERYRGGGSSEASVSEGSAAEGEEEGAAPAPPTPRTPTTPHAPPAARHQTPLDAEGGLCRVSTCGSLTACRWTLTGRGVRLRADLASPEDVSLDHPHPHPHPRPQGHAHSLTLPHPHQHSLLGTSV